MPKSKNSPKVSPVDIVGFYQPGGAISGKALDRIINYSEDDALGKSITDDSEDGSLDKEATGLSSIPSGYIGVNIPSRPEVREEQDDDVANTFFGKEDDVNLTDSFPISQDDILQECSSNKTINNEIKNETKLFSRKNKKRELNSYSKIGEKMSKENFEILKLSEALSRRGHKLASDNIISLVKEAAESAAVNSIADKVFAIWSNSNMLSLHDDEKNGLRAFIRKALEAESRGGTAQDPLQLMSAWSRDFGSDSFDLIEGNPWSTERFSNIGEDDIPEAHGKKPRFYRFNIPYVNQDITHFGTDLFENTEEYHQAHYGNKQRAQDWAGFLDNISAYSKTDEHRRILGRAGITLKQESGVVQSGLRILTYNVPRKVFLDGSLVTPSLANLSKELLGNPNYYVNATPPAQSTNFENINMALPAGKWIKIHYNPSIVNTGTWQKLRVFDKALGTSAVPGINYHVIPKDKHDKFKKAEYKGKKIELAMVDERYSGKDPSLQAYAGDRYLVRVDGVPVHNPVFVSGGSNASDGVTASDYSSDFIKMATVCPSGSSKHTDGFCYKAKVENGTVTWLKADGTESDTPVEKMDAGPTVNLSGGDTTQTETQTETTVVAPTVPPTEIPTTETPKTPTPTTTKSKWENISDGAFAVKDYIKSKEDARLFREWVNSDPERLSEANAAIAKFTKRNGRKLGTPHVLSRSSARNNYLSAAWGVLGADYYREKLSGRVDAPESGSQAMTDISNEDLRAYITMKSARATKLPALTEGGKSGLETFITSIKGLQNQGPDAFSHDNPNGLASSNPDVAARAAENLDIIFSITYYVDKMKEAFKADAAKEGPGFLAQIQMEKAQAQRAEERAKAKKKKEDEQREQSESQGTVNASNFFISNPERDGSNLPPKGTIFVARQTGEIYYIGEQEVVKDGARVMQKALYELDDRARGRGGVTGRAFLSDDEKDDLYDEMTIGQKKFWKRVFDAQENFIDSLDNWFGDGKKEREKWNAMRQEAVTRWNQREGRIGRVRQESRTEIPAASTTPRTLTSRPSNAASADPITRTPRGQSDGADGEGTDRADEVR